MSPARIFFDSLEWPINANNTNKRMSNNDSPPQSDNTSYRIKALGTPP